MAPSRREFLIVSGGTLAATALSLSQPASLRANPLGKPIGLELYTVNAELDKDYEGTLKEIAEGYVGTSVLSEADLPAIQQPKMELEALDPSFDM